MSAWEKIMRLAGSNDGNPPEARTLYYAGGREVDRTDPECYVLASGNDGFELWIGTRHQWFTHLRAEDVRLLTRWLIVDWYIKARWIGLRRPIYYFALRRHVRPLRKSAAS